MSEQTPLRTFDTAAAEIIYHAVNASHSVDDLDHHTRDLWRAWGEGRISDGDAKLLESCIQRRRPFSRTGPSQNRTVGKLTGRVGSRFIPRQRPRSPNRMASRDRRRMLGGSSVLPADLRHFYTEGQRSVLCIVAGEVKRHGICDFPIGKIAALAGVCSTTVQTTLHEARRLGHVKITERPRHGQKNLPNIVEIISQKWRTWLRRGPSAARPIGSKSSK